MQKTTTPTKSTAAQTRTQERVKELSGQSRFISKCDARSARLQFASKVKKEDGQQVSKTFGWQRIDEGEINESTGKHEPYMLIAIGVVDKAYLETNYDSTFTTPSWDLHLGPTDLLGHTWERDYQKMISSIVKAVEGEYKTNGFTIYIDTSVLKMGRPYKDLDNNENGDETDNDEDADVSSPVVPNVGNSAISESSEVASTTEKGDDDISNERIQSSDEEEQEEELDEETKERNRRLREWKPAFPHIFDAFRSRDLRGDLLEFPAHRVTKGCVVAAAFCPRVYDYSSLKGQASVKRPPVAYSTKDVTAPSPAKKQRATKDAKGHLHIGVKLELHTLWYCGSQKDAAVKTKSPTKPTQLD